MALQEVSYPSLWGWIFDTKYLLEVVKVQLYGYVVSLDLNQQVHLCARPCCYYLQAHTVNSPRPPSLYQVEEARQARLQAQEYRFRWEQAQTAMVQKDAAIEVLQEQLACSAGERLLGKRQRAESEAGCQTAEDDIFCDEAQAYRAQLLLTEQELQRQLAALQELQWHVDGVVAQLGEQQAGAGAELENALAQLQECKARVVTLELALEVKGQECETLRLRVAAAEEEGRQAQAVNSAGAGARGSRTGKRRGDDGGSSDAVQVLKRENEELRGQLSKAEVSGQTDACDGNPVHGWRTSL